MTLHNLNDGYNGNFNLKKINTPIEWTAETLQEYLKCAQDPIYFTENYVKIIHVDHGLVPFVMYDYQKTMMDSMANNRDTIITTARQTGKSTTTCAFILWYTLFHKEKTVALLANKGDTAREILGKVQLAYMHLPKWIQQGIIKWNEGSLELENDSRVIASATSSDAIRGYAINLLFIDEAAHIENWEEFFTSTAPTISSGKTTKTILVSTPFGLNHFHKLFEEAKNGRNQYNPIEVMWWQVPGRDEEWKQKTISQMGGDMEKFEQEHCCSFIGSSGTLIAGWKLKELFATNPIMRNDGFCQYELPIKGHQYVAILDVSRGKGLDYSAMQMIDVSTMPYKQVCVYRNNLVTPQDFAAAVFHMLKAYEGALCLVEVNDIGAQVADILFDDYEFDNLLFTENAGVKGKRITAGFGKSVDRGVRTTKIVKNVGCSMIKLLIEQNQLILHDKETIREFNTFSKKLNSYEAEPGCHDDLVMCMVLFGWLSSQQYFKELTDINTLAHLRDQTEAQIESELLPFMVSTGIEDIPEIESGVQIVDTYSNF
jgi:hypothetical protein